MTRQYTVLYLEPVPPDVEAIVRSRLPEEFSLRVRRSNETVESLLPEADFVLVATTPLPATVFVGASRLKLVQHQGVGYNKTDVAAAAARRIPVALCPSGTSTGVAEHVFLLILALYKRLLLADASMREGKFYQWELRSKSFELNGKTLGIIGLGRIGQEVAHRAQAFGAEIIYYDTMRASSESEDKFHARFMTLDECLANADIISLHLPLTPLTHHFIGRGELARVKPSAILINTARGPLVDENALVESLRSRQLAGAGLDVFEVEPPPKDHPLLGLENVVLTPHIAAGTVDALVIKMDACFANMLRVVRGESPIDVVTG
jgi:phosphoglycerate dehydrogenase-like enzyme